QQLVRYIMEHHVQQQFVEDVELELAFRGVRVNPTPGTAGAVGTGINGVYTVINDGITAGTIVPVAVGAAPTTAVAYMRYIEAFVEGINFRDRRRPMELAVSEAACSLFEVGMLATYNQNYEATDNLRRVFRYKNILLVPQVAMGNSTKIFCTPIGNAIKPVNVGKGPLWQFETDDRKIKAWTNTRIGYGFWDHSRVYTNDVELVPVTVPFVCAGPGYGAVTLESSGPIFGVGSSGYITVRSSDGTLTTFANGGTPTFTEDSYCIWASDAAGEPAGDLTDITIAALIPELDLSGWTALDRLCITLSGTTLDLTGPAYLDYLELLYNSALETVTVPVGLQIGNFNADGCALNEASVDALCNALDPTVTGRTSLISGGSNAAPTSASQVARDAYDVNNALYTN
ncbi:MAG TPA: hypothetical protein PLB89_04650, partial [Flavobacteriales bacterium]|nr:hypothetical protein [Flavobacteriales bacterium]